jgi:hypothetical protein
MPQFINDTHATALIKLLKNSGNEKVFQPMFERYMFAKMDFLVKWLGS